MYFTENLLIEAVYRHARDVILSDQRKMNPLKQASLQALNRIRRGLFRIFSCSLNHGKEKPDDNNGVYKRGIAGNCKAVSTQLELWKLPYRAVPCTGGRGNSVVGGISGGSFK